MWIHGEKHIHCPKTYGSVVSNTSHRPEPKTKLPTKVSDNFEQEGNCRTNSIIYTGIKMILYACEQSFHIEISRHFPHVDKYFHSLWAGAKINCKIVASHKWQWGWVVDLNKIMLDYLLRNPHCKLNAIFWCYFFCYSLFFRNMHTPFSHWSTLTSVALLKLLMEENISKRPI